MIRVFPAVTLLAMLGPVAAGLWGTVGPALGHLPLAGYEGPSLVAIRRLSEWPGLADASRLSITSGIAATALSLAIVTLVVAGWSGTRAFVWLQRLLSPLLSVPHAAAAFGVAFLIAPSGWIGRGLAMVLGWTRPPDMLIVGDSWGLSMTAGLVAKETPFLLLMTLAALGQTDSHRSMLVARSLGYQRITGWLKTVFPRVYAQIRIPVYVVLAYSMSVVDVAIILGPTTPPTLSVQIVDWMNSPDLSMRLLAAAGALLQLALVLAALAVWRLGEWAVSQAGCRWAESGGRSAADTPLRATGLALGSVSSLAVLLGLAALALWSVAGLWRFPDLVPDSLTWRSWMRHAPGVGNSAVETFAIAGIATGVAVVLTMGCLEAEHRMGRGMTRAATWLLYLPLLIPQTAFLPGLQSFLLSLGADVGTAPVIAAHLVFVLPYVFLSLSDPWRALDDRFSTVAAALGARPVRIFWSIRLPMLLRPVLTATAVGMAVSVGQYLPTLLIGGGRVTTLTTEAVALASGGDRRAIGVFALAQTGAALLPFAMALAVPAVVYRNRRGLS